MEPENFQPGEYLTFRLARQPFAIESRWVKAILPACQFTPMAQTDRTDPQWLIGHAQTGGQRFPVIDLRGRLELTPGAPGREPCIVAVDVSGGDGFPLLVGFIADRVSEVVKARARDFRQGKLRLGRPRRVLQPEEILTLEEVAAIDS